MKERRALQRRRCRPGGRGEVGDGRWWRSGICRGSTQMVGDAVLAGAGRSAVQRVSRRWWRSLSRGLLSGEGSVFVCRWAWFDPSQLFLFSAFRVPAIDPDAEFQSRDLSDRFHQGCLARDMAHAASIHQRGTPCIGLPTDSLLGAGLIINGCVLGSCFCDSVGINGCVVIPSFCMPGVINGCVVIYNTYL